MTEPETWPLVDPADPNAGELALLCKALSHPIRITILKYLMAVDRCICGDIVGLLPLAQSTVSQHLKSLKLAGLIYGEVEGPATCYCVDVTRLNRLKELIAGLDLPSQR